MSKKPVVYIAAAILVAAILLVLGATYVPAGKVAVTEKAGGLEVLESGVHFLPRWQRSVQYPVDPAEMALEVEALTPGGEVKVGVALTISVDRSNIPRLYRSYSGAYAERLISPLLQDAITTSGNSDAAGLAGEIMTSVGPALETFGVTLHGVEVTGIESAGTSEGDRRIADEARKHGSRVVILGIDAMDWGIYEIVSRDIPMPNIERLRTGGATGDLLSMEPPVSPMIWTTMATGVDPDVHGIIDFLMKDPQTGDDVPVTSTMRLAPAIWNITTRFGLTSGFIGWLGTYPAEPVMGFQVSDRVVFHTFDPRWRRGEGETRTAGDIAGLTYPENLIGELRSCIVTQKDIRYDKLRQYIRLEPGDMPADVSTFDPLDPVVNLSHIIASNTTYENMATYTYDRYKPDIMAVYLDMVDAVCHLFIKHMAPHTDDVTDEEARDYGRAIAAAYSHTDSLIGRWLDRIDDGTTLIVVSDHGFKYGDLRPAGPSVVGGGQAVNWHRMVGLIAMYGNHIKPGATIRGATVRDVCPTVLRLLGLPPADDMSGKVLAGALDETWLAAAERAGTVETYGMRSPSVPLARRSDEEDAILKRLQALGYISRGDNGEATDYTKLAQSYFAKGEFDEAIEIWNAILEEHPDDVRILTSVANAMLQKGDLRGAEATARKAMAADPEFYEAHNILTLCYINTDRLEDARDLASYIVARAPDNSGAHFNLGVVYDKMGLASRSLSEFEKSVELRGDYDESRVNLGNAYAKAGRYIEARQQLETAVAINPRSADAWFLLGTLSRIENDPEAALECYRRALAGVPSFNPARVSIAIMHATAGDLAEARRVLEEALEYNEDLELVYTNLGLVCRKMGDEDKAEDYFRKALKAAPDYVDARLDLADLYAAQGKRDRAREELQEVLRRDPANARARALIGGLN